MSTKHSDRRHEHQSEPHLGLEKLDYNSGCTMIRVGARLESDRMVVKDETRGDWLNAWSRECAAALTFYGR